MRALRQPIPEREVYAIGRSAHFVSPFRSGLFSSVSLMDAALLAWYRRFGRDLPWRRTRDPYAILVSEVMLQQTQVERVIPRWLAWLERWPNAGSLAAASTGDVIREWQGLGYNRRALNLHRAAQFVAEHGWPDDLTVLPGVGPYTAAAIRNQAYGEPVLPVDTNVARIQERTGHAFGPDALQALFDLGATVCLARVPRCEACPLAGGAPRAAAGTSRCASSRASRDRSGSAARHCCASSPPRPRPLDELDREAVDSLLRDGLVERAGELVRLPA